MSAVVFATESGTLHTTSAPEKDQPIQLQKSLSGGKSAAYTLATPPKHAQNVKFQPQCSGTQRQQNGVSTLSTALPEATPGSIRRLRSVVGSPHYIAPEIGMDDPAGYDGRKVDMWSAGIILYSLFTGSLPFGPDLTCCPRFKRYKQWINTDYAQALRDGKEKDIPVPPAWFWPIPEPCPGVGSLLVGLLHYDPALRLTAAEVMRHPWYLGHAGAGSGRSRQPSPDLASSIVMRTQSTASNGSQSSHGSNGSHDSRGVARKGSQAFKPARIPAAEILIHRVNLDSMEISRQVSRGPDSCGITRLLATTQLTVQDRQTGQLSMREQRRQKEAAASAMEQLPAHLATRYQLGQFPPQPPPDDANA